MKKNDQKQNKRRGVSQAGSATKLPPVNNKHPIPQNFSMNSISLQEQGIVSILHEYFIKNNFIDTLQSFQKDCCKPLKTNNNKNQQQLKKQLLNLFDQGQRESFMSKFTHFVPLSMRTKDPQTMKMEFFIHLYFFVYSIHPALGKKKLIDGQAKQKFSQYLEGRGASLSKSAQFLQYYALTNLQKPQQHPNFKAIFTKQWAAQLRKRVSYFLQKLYPSGKTPALVVMYDKFIEILQKQSQITFAQHEDIHQIQQQIIQEDQPLMNPQPIVHNPHQQKQTFNLVNQISFQQKDQIQILKTKIEHLIQEKDNLFDHLQNQKSKCQHWQNTYHQFSEAAQSTLMESQTKWFQITQQIYSITDQILGVCKKLQSGIPLPDPEIVDRISQKLSKYQKFIKMNLEQVVASSQPIDISLFNGDDVSVDLNKKKLIQLDFAKVKACLSQAQLAGGDEVNKALLQNKILLLQALRWRINRPRSILAKRQAVLSFTLYDILGLKTEGDKTFQTLIYSSHQNLVLQTIAFVNALTRDYYGRQYLVCQKLYKPCITLLTDESVNQSIKMQLMLSFQWCSTKKLAQELMIKYDMIKIIVFKLQKERQTIQSHYLQFLVALLVNILLHKQGPKKAEEIKGEIINALINLIQSDNQNVRSYVHASLYPLLSHRSFRQKAKEFGLLDNIKFLLENKQSVQHNHQLVYLQKKLQNDEDQPQNVEQQQQQADQDNDQDEFFNAEYREEGDEYNELNINGIKGEELLMKQYFLIGPDALTQMDKIQEIVGETLKRKSIMMDKSFYERESVNTPLLNNKLRRNISNNNSVYSNKSSNRILKSQMNSRSQINNNPNTKPIRQKLDTVPQNNSEVSIKDYEGPLQTLPERNSQEKPKLGIDQQPVLGGNESLVKKQIKVYENTDEYKNAFATRAKLVRTPPRK